MSQSCPVAVGAMIVGTIFSNVVPGSPLKTRDMLETELVTQGNEGGSVMVFLSLLPLPYGLTISSSTYGHNVTWLPM